MLNEDVQSIPVGVIVIVVILLLSQSIWLFTDARKRANNRWFWGVWGLINFPLPMLMYALFCIYLPKKRSERKDHLS
ncbi:transcriptional regulator [Paenibacillus sp. N1-5-1-14]|uniref:transcriptional regulator n=1 Tax=Paenibacillus radicibacter TaxID=2972488 RepID=UPI002158AC12|nr:transcriptional regulator [Paenibacillus radicibacter]MCR8645538.1 transcriptional regulator [Paenibacillus radicibacter]